MVFLVLACFALPQQAAAQNSIEFSLSGTMYTITIDDAAVTEGAGPALFSITIEPQLAAGLGIFSTVNYTAGTAGLEDLGSNRPRGPFHIPNGESSVTLEVPINDDDIVENEETFTVSLAIVENRFIHATGTITDNDAAVLGFAGGSSFIEEEGTTVTLPVSFLSSGASSAAVPATVAWAAVPTNRAGGVPGQPEEDLQPSSGTVTIPAGGSSADITITLVDDTDVEPAEDFFIQLGLSAANPLPAGVSLVDSSDAAYQRRGRIIDNDAPPGVNATVSIADVREVENVPGGAAIFTATLDTAVGSDVVLAVAVTGGTATLADDLGSPLPTSVTITEGNLTATFTVPIENDDIVEGDETFTVTLTADATTELPDGVTISNGTATGTITDDDEAPGDDAMVRIGDMTVGEAAGNASFTVTISEAVSSPVVLDVTYADGSAEVATDLGTPLPSTVTIAADTTEATIAVPVVDDTIVEGDETFTVTLAVNDAPDDVSIGDGVARGTIEDDDAAGVSISPVQASVREGEAFAFTVRLSQAVAAAVTVRWTAAGSGGSPATLSGESSDLAQDQAVTGTLTFDAGEAAERTFTLGTRTDDLVESDETLTVTIAAEGGLPANVSIVTDTAAGTIIDLASVLIEPRRIGAGAALRRHVKRFDSTLGTVVRSRLAGRGIEALTASQNHGSGGGAVGGGFGKTDWGAWIDGAYAGFDGNATGRQADVYGGVDYRSGNGDWLIGALVGYELAELDIGEATYDADYIHFGLYAGERLSKRLLVDVAATYGFATPEVALGDVSASYNANRLTVRGGVTGDFGFANGSVTVAPQLTAVYSRERLGGFTDSVGGVAERELLELGRFGAGPRLAWRFGPGQLAGAAHIQWDFLVLDDGVDERFSGSAEVALRFDLGGGVGLGFYGDVDGIGIMNDFVTYGGRFQLDVGF